MKDDKDVKHCETVHGCLLILILSLIICFLLVHFATDLTFLLIHVPTISCLTAMTATTATTMLFADSRTVLSIMDQRLILVAIMLVIIPSIAASGKYMLFFF